MKDMLIRLPIIATNRHCSNDCPGISLDSEYCNYFKKNLVWDGKRIANGRFRLSECKKAQLSVEKD